jgi:hypothetical protein
MGQAGHGQAVGVENGRPGTDGSTEGEHVGLTTRSPHDSRLPQRRRRAGFPVLPVVAVEGERPGPLLEGMGAKHDMIMARGTVSGAGVERGHHDAQDEDRKEYGPHRAT